MEPFNLLLVEDDTANLELMSEVFSSLSARVRPISDSTRADALIRQEKFDGIFMDLDMPKLDGLELAARARVSSWNKLTPIVIITGRSGPGVMRQAFSRGANFFIQKPVDRQKLKRLFRTVRGSLDERRRNSFRVPMQTELECRHGSRSMRGRSWNLSLGGMQIEAPGLEPGMSVVIVFSLPMSSKLVEIAGTVMWAKGERQGIRFTDLSEQSHLEIRDYMNEHFENADLQ